MIFLSVLSFNYETLRTYPPKRLADKIPKLKGRAHPRSYIRSFAAYSP